MENEIKIEPIDHDILVLKFNSFIKPETMVKTVCMRKLIHFIATKEETNGNSFKDD